MKTAVHVISHSHWDREWYLPYEQHHVRLVALMDALLELLDSDPEFHSFHLDRQTIILEDYLQVRPEQAEKLKKFVREGRLHVGPWYILQDEFLISSEANVRNLLTGMKQAREYGAVCMLGYFPDSFGNMGQAAQILRQAGIDCAVFGRGVKAVGFNNSVEEAIGNFQSPYSEMIWESPDGSQVLGILFANWYHNGMEIPVEREAARAYWEKRIAAAERFASTPHLLFMNGCDHQPVQTDLSHALRTARELFPDIEFIHSDFNQYLQQVREHLPSELTVISGELRSQRTDGWNTLVNTASSRVYKTSESAMPSAIREGCRAFSCVCGDTGYSVSASSDGICLEDADAESSERQYLRLQRRRGSSGNDDSLREEPSAGRIHD
jgi:alpha-mannosidase